MLEQAVVRCETRIRVESCSLATHYVIIGRVRQRFETKPSQLHDVRIQLCVPRLPFFDLSSAVLFHDVGNRFSGAHDVCVPIISSPFHERDQGTDATHRYRRRINKRLYLLNKAVSCPDSSFFIFRTARATGDSATRLEMIVRI